MNPPRCGWNKREKPLSRSAGLGTVVALVLLLISLAACTPTSTAGTPPVSELRVVMDNNYPPYVFADEAGQPHGILIDQWKLWSERTGVKVNITALPWSEALARMEAGEFDVIDTIFYTDDRARLFDFAPAYATIDVPIFFQSGITGIADVGDLHGFRVAVKTGDADVDYLLNHGITDLNYYSSYEAIIQAAARKEEAVFVIDQPPALYFLYKYGLQDQFNHSDPLFSGEFHRAVQKGNPALLNLIERGFATISPAEYQSIEQHWMGSRTASVLPQVMPHLLIVLVAVLSIILLLVIFNRTLQSRVRERTADLEKVAAALRISEERLRTVTENAPDTILQVDGAGLITYVSRPVPGLTREQVVGSSIFQWVPEEQYPILKETLEAVFHAGERHEYESLGPGPSGEPHTYHVRVAPVTINGQTNSAIYIATDITERKRAEEALRQSEDKFSKAFHTSPDSININRLRDGLYLEINEGFTTITGYTGEDVCGKTSLEINIWADPADRQRLVRGLRDHGQVTNLEAQFRTKDGRLITGLMSARLIEIGGELCILNIARDITERKRAEAEIQQLNQDLERRVDERTRELAAANARLTELDHLKSKFVSDVSHELRTPIANLKLYIDLLERGKPEKQSQYIAVLHQQVRRVAALVDDILDLSRLERRREQGQVYQAVALNELVEQVVLAHEPRAEADGLRLTFEPQPDLPPVRADANQIAQVVTNLVANALSYTAAGYVRISTFCDKDAVCLCVADSGSGIAPDDLPHVFERFYRGRHVLKNDVPGTGLGLAIVKEIVELHAGRIEIESLLDHGTTFRVWLPRA